jgi:hypothetical protein
MYKKTLAVLLCIVSSTSFARTFETFKEGYWSETSTWKNGEKPFFSFSDTLIVKHPIVFDSIIVAKSGAYFKIENGGAICGHHFMYINCNFDIFGYFQADGLVCNVGVHINLSGSHQSILTQSGLYSNGCSFSVSSGGLSVGPWFECREFDYQFTKSIPKINLNKPKVFYVNEENMLVIQKLNATEHIIIQNLLGQILMEEKSNDSEIKIPLKTKTPFIIVKIIQHDRKMETYKIGL